MKVLENGPLLGKIKNHILKKWQSSWQSKPSEYKRTRKWFPIPNEKLSQQLIKLDRLSLGRIVQGITGFNRLMRHESKVSPEVDPTCRLCLEDDESFWHLISECPALWKLRRDIFHWYFPPDVFEWKVYQILKFVENPQIRELMNGQ